MKFCPYDCTACSKPACRVDGCERTGEKMLDTCEQCGTLYVAVHYATHCTACDKNES